MDDSIPIDERLKKQSRGSQPSSRKSRSISRYFLGNKRSSIDITTQDIDIARCLTSIGIFDACDLWTNVTLFRDYTTCRRLLIITNQNQLFIGKPNQKQSLFKVKHQIDLNRVWSYSNLTDSIASEITSLTYYDAQRTLIIGWPLAENFLVEFDTNDIRDIWHDRIQTTLNSWWSTNNAAIEHVRIVIDQNQESDQNNNPTSFVIRKVIGIRPQDTVRDLIKKCIDTSYLRDASVENYLLYAFNETSNPAINQCQWIPLIGHEYPYAIKMKHIKPSHNNISLDNDEHFSLPSAHHHSSTTSLNNISIKSHDFELRKRDHEHPNKKHRFFHKRKTKENFSKPSIQTQINDDHYLLTNFRTKSSGQFFGLNLDELISKSHHQLPAVIQQLLEILYFKGPETTGIFRKVANTRSVKESIDKIERNIPLQEDDLHPILAAGIFKHFLRTLPEPVFNAIQYDNWKKCLRLPTIPERITFARRSIISTLSESHHLLLKGFICILYRISQEADSNGMNPFNLGLCVSNSLFKTESTTITSGKQEADVMSSIVEFLIVNSSSLFGSDVLTCIPDKHIIVHQIPNLIRPAASSIESLDEVESSPHLPVVNRSRDSGLATSDQPFNDDSSEVSEHFRRYTSPLPPNWISSIACGTGTVLTSILLPPTTRRNLKVPYKPSKQFMEREKLTNDTTDDSEHEGLNEDSSVRSSTTTVHNMTVGKIKRSKPISRHSSLGSNEHHQQFQQQQQLNLTKESKRVGSNDVKRASSLKQFHHQSDEGDNDDDEQNKTMNANNNNNNNNNNTKKKVPKNEAILSMTSSERRAKLLRAKSKQNDEESMMTRSVHVELQDLDLTSEPLSTINQRLINTTTTARSASFSINSKIKKLDSPFLNQTSIPSNHSRPPIPQPPPIILDGRSRHNGPLAATTNQIYNTSRIEHHSQTHSLSTDRDRTFVHRADSRPFKLGTAIQMKPMDELLSSANGRRRPCHRQNALRYKSADQDQPEKRSSRQTTTPMMVNDNRVYSSNENPAINISRHQSIERRVTTPPMKSFSFDMNPELLPSDISWSVREKAKFFEHTNEKKFSTGRENYV